MCGIIRTYGLQGLSAQSDYSYETVSLVLGSASELLITIICANIPMLRPLWSQLRGKNSSSGTSGAPDSGNENPTIGGSNGNKKRYKDPNGRLCTWNELDEIDSGAGGTGGGTFASRLGGSRQGKNRTVVQGSLVDNEDARSFESILREDNRVVNRDARGIEVSRQFEVREGSVPEVGRAW